MTAATFKDGYPRVCAGCGLPAKRSEASWHENRLDGKPLTWHFACRAAARIEASA